MVAKEVRGVTVIVPVYGDMESLRDCIVSLKEHVGPSHKVLFVNDCGPDANEIELGIKSLIKGVRNFEYHRNTENLGFLKNCNRAVFELDTSSNDILLLNSDTIVTSGFIEELELVLKSDSDIVAVSPRSNNATIATVPIRAMIDKSQSPEDSYAVFLRIKDSLPQYNISPVAHGFCLLIRRSAIDKLGLFDEVYGKGYGEEVDFCLRAAAAGYKSAICNRSFVYHMEARSFTLERKKQLIAINERVVEERYPQFRTAARDYRLSIERQESRLLDSFFVRWLRVVEQKIKSQPAIRKMAVLFRKVIGR